jgi:hypothetical protein
VPPAVSLLYKFCRDASTDRVLNGCLKAIGVGYNFKEVGAPSFVSQYNGKPVLMAAAGKKNQRSGFTEMYRQDNYIECDVDMGVHFSFFAQKGLVWGVNQCVKLDTALAFLIEGRNNSQLPECVLGCLKQRFFPVTGIIDDGSLFGDQQESPTTAAPGVSF